MSADPRRRLALDSLISIDRGGALESALDRARLALPADADFRFVVELVKGALQWRGRYDHLVTHFSRRRATRDRKVAGILLLSLHQLLAMDGVPDYAALHQAGELCRAAGRRGATGYVNGLLRSVRRLVAEHGEDAGAAVRAVAPARDTDPAGHLAVVHSFPRWLVGRWLERFGYPDCERLLEETNRPAPVCLHVLAPARPEEAAEALERLGAKLRHGSRHPRALVLEGGIDRPTLRSWLERVPGLIVQDEGAQEVTDWFGEDLQTPVCDLCAAPGGKAVHLAARLAGEERLIAVDLRPRRLALLRDTVQRLGETRIAVVAGDGVQPPLRAGAFATVLVDGPCSGTGVLRHHPEGRWRLRPGTLERNSERLVDLLGSAVELLAPQGTLYYATCSLEPEENEHVIAAILASRRDLVRASDASGRAERSWLPQTTGTDGFFAARLRRRGGPA